MLAGIYYGAAYGGSTTAILVNLPGEASAAVTCLDGYKMARNGRVGPALAIAAVGSFFAGTVGTLLLAVAAPPLTKLALNFGAPEYFALILLALATTAILVRGSILKGLAIACVGVMVGLVGIDTSSGVERFTFGSLHLVDGIEFAAVAMGLFAVTEIISNLQQKERQETFTNNVTGLMPTRKDLKESFPAMARGTAVGSFFGILPGVGQTISSFAAYAIEKKISRNPEKFGTGAIEGVAAPESANNAAAQTSFIPTLTLGVPGSATMALMLGALMMQGITPGPQVISTHPGLFWGLVVSMWLGNMLLVVLNLPLVGIWVSMLKIPYRWLYPIILAFSALGIYTLNFSTHDIGLMVLFGVVGYAFMKLGYEPAPFILGFLLGPMLEENFRRAMRLSRGSYDIFWSKPLSAVILTFTICLVVMMLLPSIRKKRQVAVDNSD